MTNWAGTRVFLIEDHHIMRHGLATLLTTEFQMQIIGEAASGEEALEKIATLNEKPELIIVDIALPGMNGAEVIREILKRDNKIKILVLSMYNNPSFVYQALKAGAIGYILKQSLVEELEDAIKHIMRNERFISLSIAPSPEYAIGNDKDSMQVLTHRELEIFQCLAEGKSVKEIADHLVLSIFTVYTHINNIKNKLGVDKNSDIVRYAIENSIMSKK
ncbi:MAG: response regulator transcription factor [Anaerolineales bacterium]